MLNYRANFPEADSETMAAELTRQLQRETPWTSAGVRKTLQRARGKFAELLIDEVSQMCGAPDRDELQSALVDLRLISYCRPAWQ